MTGHLHKIRHARELPYVTAEHKQRIRALEAQHHRWIEPVFTNGWTNAGPPYDDVAYRYGLSPKTLEFKGHLVPGSSGTSAFTLEENYRPTKDVSWLTDILVGGSFMVARVQIVAASGNVVITYPAS